MLKTFIVISVFVLCICVFIWSSPCTNNTTFIHMKMYIWCIYITTHIT